MNAISFYTVCPGSSLGDASHPGRYKVGVRMTIICTGYMHMATNLTVDSADNSARWYITPGNSSTYDLQVHNDTDRAVLCRVTLSSHPDTGTVKPQSLTLQARETRNVSVTFGPEARLPRDRKAVIMIKDAAGQVLSTVERELVSGSSTDATLVLAWKEPIVENDKLCGFVLLCTIRSL